MNKLIMTIDIDAFFVSCEELRNSSIKKIPTVISNELNGRGVISTANYKAREFGIHSGMPLFHAKKIIKNLKIIPPDFEFYQKMGNKVFEIISKYTKKIEIASIDECFVDLTNLTNKYKPIQIAKLIKEDIYKNTNLTVSIGISTNLFLSKIASGLDKPNGLTTLWKHELKDKLWPLKINKLYMVGEKTAELFNKFEIYYIYDLIKLDKKSKIYNDLKIKLGVNLDKLISEANGKLEKEIIIKNENLKSISREVTFAKSLININQIKKEARTIANYIFQRMKKRKLIGDTINVFLKKNGTFKKISTSKKNSNLHDWEIFWISTINLIERIYKENSLIKQLGISVSGLKKEERVYKQLKLENINNNLENKINNNIDEKNDLQNFVDKISMELNIDLVLGETFINNRRYESKKFLDKDKIKFKNWEN